MRPLLIIDFEATCWDDDRASPPRIEDHRYVGEIIEFGCALLNGDGAVIERTWQQYVQPVFKPALSSLCTELTGITQATVDGAPTFPDALHKFCTAFKIQGNNQPYFASWGNYDRNALMDDCAKHGVAYPFGEGNHINLKAEAKRVFGFKKRMGLSLTLEVLGFEFEGCPHSGVDDAYNIGRIALEMFNRGWHSPVTDAAITNQSRRKMSHTRE